MTTRSVEEVVSYDRSLIVAWLRAIANRYGKMSNAVHAAFVAGVIDEIANQLASEYGSNMPRKARTVAHFAKRSPRRRTEGVR